MSRGLTIAELVQQVYYAIYKVRIDVEAGVDGAFASKSDKFKEVVMEANLVLQEFQKEADWTAGRSASRTILRTASRSSPSRPTFTSSAPGTTTLSAFTALMG